MATKDGPSESMRRSLKALRRAYDNAAAEVEASQDAKRAYDGATQMTNELLDYADQAAQLRALQATRIYDEERISLAALADRLSISKARAGQLVEAARKGKQSRRGR